MLGMNQEQTLALLRQLLPVLGGIAMTFGWLTSDQVAKGTATILQIAGPAMIVGSTIWTLFHNTKASLVTTVAAMPEVQIVKLESTMAGRALEEATPTAPNVTTSPSINPMPPSKSGL